MVRSVLFHGVDLAGNKIAERVPRGCGSRGLKGENPKVIQVTDDHVLVQCQFGAEIDGVLAFRHADQIAERVEVRRGDRTGERSTIIEISRHVYVRECLWPLDRKIRSQISKRNLRQVDASPRPSCAVEPALVDGRGAEGVNVAEVQVLLL